MQQDHEINVSDFQALSQAHVIDIREDSEWAEGYIDGAIHRPMQSFLDEGLCEPVDKDIPTVLYCRSGKRSLLCVRILKGLGYQGKLYSLQGGIQAYQRSGD